MNNYAFIDAQNLYLGVNALGWKIDYRKFRVYLKEKYKVEKAYMFMGFLPNNQDLYNFLQTVGFVLIFKPILEKQNGEIKGNCDAELVLQAMIDYESFEKAVIVTGDGDFSCLVKYFKQKNKLKMVLVPSQRTCSVLLRNVAQEKIALVSDLKNKLSYDKKAPPKDKTLKGALKS